MRFFHWLTECMYGCISNCVLDYKASGPTFYSFCFSKCFCCFRWTKNHKGSSNPLVVLKERIIKLPALTRGQWHHLVISFIQPKLSAEMQKELDGDDNLPSSMVGTLYFFFYYFRLRSWHFGLLELRFYSRLLHRTVIAI